MSAGRETIAFDEAVKRLPDGDTIHTFRNPMGMLVGADWPREAVLEAMRKVPAIDVTGEAAQALHHGLSIEEGGSVLFIETKP